MYSELDFIRTRDDGYCVGVVVPKYMLTSCSRVVRNPQLYLLSSLAGLSSIMVPVVWCFCGSQCKRQIKRLCSECISIEVVSAHGCFAYSQTETETVMRRSLPSECLRSVTSLQCECLWDLNDTTMKSYNLE